MDVHKSLEILKSNFFIFIHVDGSTYVLVDANKEQALEKFSAYKNNFQLIVDSENRLDSYVSELNPLAYDLVELSEKPMVLKLPQAKNVQPLAMQEHQHILIRVLREGSLKQLIQRYKLPLILCELPDDYKEVVAEFSMQTEMQDAFEEASYIFLAPNGRVEILKN